MGTKKELTINDNILLKEIINNIPYYVFWKDGNLVFQGCNKLFANQFGYTNSHGVVGKNDKDFPWPQHLREKYNQDDIYVIKTGRSILNIEETQTQPNGSTKTVLVSKVPLRLKDNTIGVLGIYTDITERKKMETELVAAQEKEKFVKIANQVAHDIRSPLASMLMIIKSCTGVPEAERIALREAAMNMEDIVNSLLNQYKSSDTTVNISERQPLLVSVTLMQLLTDKKYEYPGVSWTFNVSQTGHFTFIKMASSPFKRMLSNLINNAVDACEEQAAKIDIQLNADNEWVTISIKDNGKGIPPEILKKIKQQIATTNGKKEGHGIGLTQVHDTLQNNQGEISFESTIGKGTIVTLTFPRIKAPTWMAEEIQLKSGDLLIILDDDTSIHQAWKLRFKGIITEKTNIDCKHFSTGQEALDFILSLSTDQKERVFLLTDYELLKQDLDGLTVIEKSAIKRSLLVTSHYTNPSVRERAAKMGSKILPKQMASEIPIAVIEIETSSQPVNTDSLLESVDIVIVDDNENFVNNLTKFIFRNLKVDCYYNPQHFLSHVNEYKKHTKMILDNQFDGSNISGVDLAKHLHEQGFTKLYLLSGKEFSPGEVPDYIKVIRKDAIKDIRKIANK